MELKSDTPPPAWACAPFLTILAHTAARRDARYENLWVSFNGGSDEIRQEEIQQNSKTDATL